MSLSSFDILIAAEVYEDSEFSSTKATFTIFAFVDVFAETLTYSVAVESNIRATRDGVTPIHVSRKQRQQSTKN